MGKLTRFDLRRLKRECGVNELVETGTGLGVSLQWAHECGIEKIVSIEQHLETHEQAQANLRHLPNIELLCGASLELLQSLTAGGKTPRLIFLDAHFINGADFKDIETWHASAADPRSFPLIDELDLLIDRISADDWVIIDDARLYVEGVFAFGECPDWARRWSQRADLDARLARFGATHSVQLLRQDHGYLLLVPKSLTTDWRDIVKVIPGDPAGNGVLEFPLNVPGVTSISMQRRLADHRFATRYFVGQGLDVGGGIDTLALFQEFFPLATCISRYDIENGDAQYLRNVDDGAFDFVYSSHCLEHMRDPRQALESWLRVVRGGGYLVIQVPDEDLYEQGQWPSRFNPDHKRSFTICKTSSWSPVSVNVLDLLREFASQARIISLNQIDQGYRTKLVPPGIDQTRTPMAECGIEFVLQKY